ncbi:MAG: hypothetical protein GXY34_07400 [Syntrophomonadaceae bacterium]|nr:hypothetical protein [Syntrophomonadaceae bacterium]
MTELQTVFLFYTFLYFIMKGALCALLYVALIVWENMARQRHERFLTYLRQKRNEEQIKWEVAYRLYENKNDVHQKTGPLDLSQLINNPNSFSAYSFVKPL